MQTQISLNVKFQEVSIPILEIQRDRGFSKANILKKSQTKAVISREMKGGGGGVQSRKPDGEQVCIRAKWPIKVALVSGFCSRKWLEVFLSPWMGCWPIAGLLKAFCSSVSIYSPVQREAL